MADPLHDLLTQHLPTAGAKKDKNVASTLSNDQVDKYLARLLSLRVTDLTTTEPLSLSQASQSNLLSIQALSSRAHRTTTTSSDHLSTLQESLPSLSLSLKEVREAIPALDESAVAFASTYSRSRDQANESQQQQQQQQNVSLTSRKESQLLSRQADKLQDILELPQLLSAAIASAGSGSAGSTNYSQALDLFAHIRRLQIIYPDSALIRSVLSEAEAAMKDMTTNLINSLRSQNIRLAAAIRTIGWLRRVAPELNSSSVSSHLRQQHQQATPLPDHTSTSTTSSLQPLRTQSVRTTESTPDEGSFGLLFLTVRLSTFLQMTEALSPLRDLADQETDRRTSNTATSPNLSSSASTTTTTTNLKPSTPSRRPSSTLGQYQSTGSGSPMQGQQTERYLKRYVEIFREQSFSTISMYRNIFPPSSASSGGVDDEDDAVSLPPALQTFPLHLVEILIETLRIYLPNVTDFAARESLLMQVLYAANSLGRLGADFTMMIALLDSETKSISTSSQVNESEESAQTDTPHESENAEPEWARVIKKHRVQSARLEALATGQDQSPRRTSYDVTVR